MKLVFYWLACTFLILSSCQNNTSPSSNDTAPPATTPATDSVEKITGSSNSTISTDYRIIPGKSIGRTMLGEDAETLAKTLGKPDFSDAAMGKAWLIWFGKQRDEHNNRTELDVYVTYKDSNMTAKVVKEIRTTSSAFKVNDSVHVYADLSTLKNSFPAIKPVKKYKARERNITIYDDVDKGIAFDVVEAGDQQICIGIIVHEQGKSVNDVYIRLQEAKNTR